MLELIRLARPTHWVKNGFVAAPLLFVLPDPFWPPFARCLLAVAAFSLAASAIYAVNDVVDAEADRAHPTKRLRPVAAGRVSPGAAILWAAVLAAAAIALSWRTLPPLFLATLGTYAANNVLYNALVKRHRIADVISIAVGFVLRLVAGSVAIGVAPSSWLLVCGFSLALFLGFG
jgi:4-hydroxybenzoate polyprenyltransferase